MASRRVDSDQDTLQNGSAKVKPHLVPGVEGSSLLFSGGLHVRIRYIGEFHQFVIGNAKLAQIVTNNMGVGSAFLGDRTC